MAFYLSLFVKLRTPHPGAVADDRGEGTEMAEGTEEGTESRRGISTVFYIDKYRFTGHVLGSD
jgi:hypothetical protein